MNLFLIFTLKNLKNKIVDDIHFKENFVSAWNSKILTCRICVLFFSKYFNFKLIFLGIDSEFLNAAKFTSFRLYV